MSTTATPTSLQVDKVPDSTRIGSDLSSCLSSWRNSLLCASRTRPLLYLAARDHILVYERLPARIGEVPYLRDLANPTPRPVPTRPYGARPGPFDNAEINAIKTFMLGSEEVLVTVDGLGRVIIRYIDNLDLRPLVFEVGHSTWGLDLHGRTIVVSSNSHDVHLIHLATSEDSSDAPAQQVHVGGSGHKTLRGALANIPSVSISSDGKLVAAVDVYSSLNIWEIDSIKEDITLPTLHIEECEERAMGWSCQWVPESAFAVVAHRHSDDISTRKPEPNPIRSMCPNLSWWAAVGANVMSDLDDSADLQFGEHMRSIGFMSNGLGVDPQFERHWQTPTIELFQTFEERTTSDLLLVTFEDRIILLHPSDYSWARAVCIYPFGAKCVTNHCFERINMVKPCFELGIVAIATQSGLACIFELIRCAEVRADDGTSRSSYSMRGISIISEDVTEQNGELIGFDLVQVSSRRATLIMLFRSGKITRTEIERPDDGGGAIEQLML